MYRAHIVVTRSGRAAPAAHGAGPRDRRAPSLMGSRDALRDERTLIRIVFARSLSRSPAMRERSRAARANQITALGALVNFTLLAAKLAAGVFGHSQAMLADAIHTLTDFATDLIVFVGVFFSKKPIDLDHPYGHGKYETLAAVLIGFALAAVGLRIGYDGGQAVWAVLFDGLLLPAPHWLAFAVAVASILAKEWIYRLTAKVGEAINSPVIIANAWHHRSDALSSIGTAVGIGGAVFLGAGWSVLDPLAALIVSFFILKAAASIIGAALGDLTDAALSPDQQQEILELAATLPGVQDPHRLRSRKVGPTLVMEIHIRVDPDLTVRAGHDIASALEATMHQRFGADTIVTVHVEPAVATAAYKHG